MIAHVDDWRVASTAKYPCLGPGMFSTSHHEHDTKSAEGDSNVVTSTESVSVEQKRKASRRPSPPPPSPLKRTIFFVFTGFLFWFLLAKLFGLGQQKEPEIVYAQRYAVPVLLAGILLILDTQILERIQV